MEASDNSAAGAYTLYALGVGSARTGDLARANEAEQRLAAMRLEGLRLAIAGWKAQQTGQKAVAIQLLRRGADIQDRMGAGYMIVKPVREMLADLLLMNGEPGSALVEYKAVLSRLPNRFDSVYGAGTAAFETGDLVTAKMYYSQLLSQAKGNERAELVTARSRMTQRSVAAGH